MSPETFDLAVIGGGLTGTAVARDAAGRGLSVFLVEALDIGEGASSATGGVVLAALDAVHRFAFRHLRADAAELATLAASAPHLVRPILFLLPRRAPGTGWRLRLGRVALGWIAGASVRRQVRREGEHRQGWLRGDVLAVDEIGDCLADDSRLAVLNALDARFRGARICPRVRCIVAEREGDHWRLSLESTVSGEPSVVHARALVNAAGAAVAAVNDHVVHTERRFGVHLHKRSYVVVRRALPEGEGYALPRRDGSIVYVVPIAGDLALVGPRTVPYAGEDATLTIDAGDVADLVGSASSCLEVPLRDRDVVSGLTALWASPAKGASRQWAIEVDAPPRQPPLAAVVGATLGTHRRAAEAAVSAVGGPFPKARPAWTAGAQLPGGAFPAGGVSEIGRALGAAYRFLPPAHVQRLASAYGTRAHEILIGCRVPADLGRCFGADLTEVEVNYLRREEWAETAADILWRRTKLGFHVSAAEAAALDAWLARHRVAAPGPVMP